jgi:hypothetical protein
MQKINADNYRFTFQRGFRNLKSTELDFSAVHGSGVLSDPEDGVLDG